jgi:hypothetical protein
LQPPHAYNSRKIDGKLRERSITPRMARCEKDVERKIEITLVVMCSSAAGHV